MNAPRIGLAVRVILILVLSMLGILLLSGCERGAPFRVVEVRFGEGLEGNDEGLFTHDMYAFALVPTHEGEPARIPLRQGDRLSISDVAWVEILPSDGEVLEFGGTEPVLTLAGSPVLLDLGNVTGWTWLSIATPQEKASLRAIMLNDPLSKEHRSLMEDLASHNPNLMLAMEEEGDLPFLLRIFDPEELALEHAPAPETGNLLAGERELRRLTIPEVEDSRLDFLSSIPKLEELFLGGWDPEELGPLPDSISKLKSLLLGFTEVGNLAALGRQPDLEELMFFGCGEDEGSGSLDISGIADFPKLELVAFRACEVEDLSFLTQLDRLEWLALPAGIDQSQFAAVVSDLPDLVFLEALESEDITDLSPLAGLPRLKGLMVEDDAPLDPLFELDQLEYLAVMSGGSDSTFVSEVLEPLQAELPTTVIGRIEPFCLGSGYILLLIPLVGLAGLAVRRRRRTPIPATKNG